MSHLCAPSLPSGEVTAALCGDYPLVKAALEEYGIAVITARQNDALPAPISRHCDMLCCHIAPDIVITHDDSLRERLQGYGIRAIQPSTPPGDKYPRDVSLNCAVIGDCLLCNTSYCAPEVLDTA
ncbi:MAG: hypothetical protein IJP17_06955, partial [Clostridia bacterium]|nr:hypothetical protein [Clostridia bacterium]